jgi:hypothetical protein
VGERAARQLLGVARRGEARLDRDSRVEGGADELTR